MKPKVLFGIELETTFSKRKLGDIYIAGYHSSDPVEYCEGFYPEGDSSIRPSNKFSGKAEFISRPFERKELKQLLNAFKKKTHELCGKKYEFGDVFNINRTCGCHIHFSVLCRKRPSDVFVAEFKDYKKKYHGYKSMGLRHLFNDTFKKLIRSNVFYRVRKRMPKYYKRFSSSYYRSSYAAKVDKVDNCSGKYYEFNLSKAHDRIEYRSFHVQSIKTWKELYEIIDIALESIERAVYNEFRKDYLFARDYDVNDLDSLYDTYFNKSKRSILVRRVRIERT